MLQKLEKIFCPFVGPLFMGAHVRLNMPKSASAEHLSAHSAARCILFANGPADATAIPKPHHLLTHLDPDWF